MPAHVKPPSQCNLPIKRSRYTPDFDDDRDPLTFGGRTKGGVKKHAGLNSRLGDMLMRANMSFAAVITAPEPKRAGLRSFVPASSGCNSEVPQTPLDSILNASVARNLGENFTVIKASRSISIHDSRGRDFFEHDLLSWRDEDRSKEREPTEKRVPVWLSQTFSLLEADNPLRALCVDSQKAHNQVPVTNQDIPLNLNTMVTPKKCDIFAFSPATAVTAVKEEEQIIKLNRNESEPDLSASITDLIHDCSNQPYSKPGPFAPKSVHFLTPKRNSPVKPTTIYFRDQSLAYETENNYTSTIYNPYAAPGPASNFSLPYSSEWLSSPTAIEPLSADVLKPSNSHSSPGSLRYINKRSDRQDLLALTSDHNHETPPSEALERLVANESPLYSILHDTLDMPLEENSNLYAKDSRTLSLSLPADEETLDEITEDEVDHIEDNSGKVAMRFIAREHETMVQLANKVDEIGNRDSLDLTSTDERPHFQPPKLASGERKMPSLSTTCATGDTSFFPRGPGQVSIYTTPQHEGGSSKAPIELLSSSPYVRLSLDVDLSPGEDDENFSCDEVSATTVSCNSDIPSYSKLNGQATLSSPDIRLSRLPSPSHLGPVSGSTSHSYESPIILPINLATLPCTPPPKTLYHYHKTVHKYDKRIHRDSSLDSKAAEQRCISPIRSMSVSKTASQLLSKLDTLVNPNVHENGSNRKVQDEEVSEQPQGKGQERIRKFRPSFASTTYVQRNPAGNRNEAKEEANKDVEGNNDKNGPTNLVVSTSTSSIAPVTTETTPSVMHSHTTKPIITHKRAQTHESSSSTIPSASVTSIADDKKEHIQEGNPESDFFTRNNRSGIHNPKVEDRPYEEEDRNPLNVNTTSTNSGFYDSLSPSILSDNDSIEDWDL